MKPIPLNPETEPVALRVVWFEPPEEAMSAAQPENIGERGRV